MNTLDIPQANDLSTVRAVVSAVGSGAPKVEDVVERTGFSRRHVQYRVHAARVLGLLAIEGETLTLTRDGERLLATHIGTHDERAAFCRAIEASPELRVFAPDLTGPQAPFASDLCERILAVSKLSPNTAMRRAEGLLSWRRQVLDQVVPTAAPPPPAEKPRQLSLFD